MSLQNKLKLMLNTFLEIGDETDLLKLLEDHPEIVSCDYGEFPDFHRITDIQLGSKYFRICRQISLGEKLSFMQIDEMMGHTAGVPLWLKGEKLRAWAEAEEEGNTGEPVNWENYR